MTIKAVNEVVAGVKLAKDVHTPLGPFASKREGFASPGSRGIESFHGGLCNCRIR